MAFILTKDSITPSLNQKLKKLETVSKQAYTFFKEHTPIKSGNARSKTRLDGDLITAGYAYARRLDNGASSQAPDGMSKPTRAFIQKTADGILKRK